MTLAASFLLSIMQLNTNTFHSRISVCLIPYSSDIIFILLVYLANLALRFDHIILVNRNYGAKVTL